MLLRNILLDKPFLHIPVDTEGERHALQIWCGNALIREFYLSVTDREGCAFYFLDMGYLLGRTLTLILPEPGGLSEKALGGILTGGDAVAGNPLYPGLYGEALRPQFHFSSRRGWLNDPNGLVYAGGLYHLYYQHNPLGVTHGTVNICWGHAVSEDLIHWRERSDAILPWRRDWSIASGSALVDTENAAGYGAGAIVAAFTALGTYSEHTGEINPSGGQFMAASVDGGDTFYLYGSSATVPAENGEGCRDPRLFRHGDHYVMAVYETESGRNCVSFYVSTNLRNWRRTARLPDLFECPDLFPLRVQDGETRWVLFGADGLARLGAFDGYSFAESGESHPLDYGNATYAGQTWNGQPEGRRILMSWVRGLERGEGREEYHGMPFSQCMTVPCELTLRRDGKGYRVLKNPAREVDGLRAGPPERFSVDAEPETSVALLPQSDYLFTLPAARQPLEMDIGGHTVRFDGAAGTLAFETGNVCALPPGNLVCRVLVDTTTVELFFADGIAATYAMEPGRMRLTLRGGARVACERWPMRSIWR